MGTEPPDNTPPTQVASPFYTLAHLSRSAPGEGCPSLAHHLLASLRLAETNRVTRIENHTAGDILRSSTPGKREQNFRLEAMI